MPATECAEVVDVAPWRPMATAPRDRSNILLLLGESIPDTPYVRVGSYVSDSDAQELGEDGAGWMVWDSDGSSWSCISEDEVKGWAPLPSRAAAR